MNCPKCGCETSVINSRLAVNNNVRRRRKCSVCGYRFTTFETIIRHTAKQNKVMDGLERCINKDCDYCPYASDCEQLERDALYMLTARLVTLKDFENADSYGWLPVWTQTKDDFYCECIKKDALREDYDKPIRYWISKPTEEQRNNW